MLTCAMMLVMLGSAPAKADCSDSGQAARDTLLRQVPGFGGKIDSWIHDYVPSFFGDSIAELHYYWRFRETPPDDAALDEFRHTDFFAALQTYSHERDGDAYHSSELMVDLIQRHLLSNRNKQNDADWWLDGAEEWRDLDLARWLQGMAASDHWHRAHSRRRSNPYVTLLTSWATYDPWAHDKDGYRAVTDDALARWEERGDLLWGVLAYARMHPLHERADALIERFEALHQRVRHCVADRAETLAYAPMRFHALRLMITRDRARYWPRVLKLLDEQIPPFEDRYLKERAAAYLAIFSSGRAALVDLLNRAHWLKQDYHWLTAQTLDEFTDGMNAHGGRLPKHFTGRNGRADIYGAWNFIDAFSSEALLYITSKLKPLRDTPGQMTARERMAGIVFVRGFALEDWALQERALRILQGGDGMVGFAANTLLTAPASEREQLALLMLIDAKDDLNIRWNGKAAYSGYFWCNIVVDHDARAQLANRVWSGWSLNDVERPRLALPRWRRVEGVPDVIDPVELARIAALPPAPELFLRRAARMAAVENTRWKRLLARIGIGGDAWVGELLHRLILLSKTRCDWFNDPEAGRLAWRELHRNPAWAVWAEKTPYWFKSRRAPFYKRALSP